MGLGFESQRNHQFESQVVMIQSDSFCGSKRILISMEDSENGENMAHGKKPVFSQCLDITSYICKKECDGEESAQSEMAVHMLN